MKLRCSFRLRTMLVIVSLAGAVCAREANRLNRRARAIELLARAGLYVRQEAPRADQPPWCFLPAAAYRWCLPWSSKCWSVNDMPWACPESPLAAGSGAPAFWRASREPDARAPTRAERRQLVAAIATLAELESLQAPFPLEDDDLRALCPLAHLRCIEFDACRITEEGVVALRELRGLERISLDFAGAERVAAETVAGLSGHPCLGRVSLAGLPADTVARAKAAMPHVEVAGCPGRRRRLPR